MCDRCRALKGSVSDLLDALIEEAAREENFPSHIPTDPKLRREYVRLLLIGSIVMSESKDSPGVELPHIWARYTRWLVESAS